MQYKRQGIQGKHWEYMENTVNAGAENIGNTGKTQ